MDYYSKFELNKELIIVFKKKELIKKQETIEFEEDFKRMIRFTAKFVYQAIKYSKT